MLVTKEKKNKQTNGQIFFKKALMSDILPTVWSASSYFKLQNKQGRDNF